MTTGPTGILALAIIEFSVLGVSIARAAPDSNSVVAISAGVQVTAESLGGVSFSQYHRVWTNGLAWNNYDQLREQTGAHRTKTLAEAQDLAALTVAIEALSRTQYADSVRRSMALRLAEELVLRREPVRLWYHDPRAMRDCNDYSSRLWSAENRVWDAALAGLPANEIKGALLEAYRANPPAWLAQTKKETWAESRHLQRMVDQTVSLRSKGLLERWVTGLRGLNQPQYWRLRDPVSFGEWQWIYAEIFNWWTSYVVKALELRPDDVELERICRPMMPRYVLVANVERDDDLTPVERMVQSVKDVAGVRLDWTEYQQALGFEREFGFTNRHLAGVVVTNGLLGQLLVNVDQIPKTPLALPSKPVGQAPLRATFVPYRVIKAGETNQPWVPVRLTPDGEKWAARQLGVVTGNSGRMRAWIGPELDKHGVSWDYDAGEMIREITFERIARLRLRPTVEAMVAEYSHRSPTLFPTVEQVLETLMLWRGLPFDCGDAYSVGMLLKEPIPR